MVVYFFTNFGDGRVGSFLSPPFSVSYRDSLLGQGLVVDIKNPSDQTLRDVRVKITARNGKSTAAFVTEP